jgi:hypothetical protein
LRHTVEDNKVIHRVYQVERNNMKIDLMTTPVVKELIATLWKDPYTKSVNRHIDKMRKRKEVGHGQG